MSCLVALQFGSQQRAHGYVHRPERPPAATPQHLRVLRCYGSPHLVRDNRAVCCTGHIATELSAQQSGLRTLACDETHTLA